MPNIKLPNDLTNKIQNAVEFFWNTRKAQTTKQIESAGHDQGNRSAVTGGKQLDGFVELIKEILILNGVPENTIFTDTGLELPGFYRPSKKWDLLVVSNNQLLIAIEFKSQVGPSFGNNFNNRTEEAMGSALDIWTAYREGAFGVTESPWLGYFLVLEDCDKSTTNVRTTSNHFPVRDEFINASYKKRYELFCQKLVLERQYSSACFVTTKYSSESCSYSYPNDRLTFDSYIKSMVGYVLAHSEVLNK